VKYEIVGKCMFVSELSFGLAIWVECVDRRKVLHDYGVYD